MPVFNFAGLSNGTCRLSSEQTRFLLETEETFFPQNKTCPESGIAVETSHELLRTGAGEWYILSELKGEGAYARVYVANYKIVLRTGFFNDSAHIIPVSAVAKIQSYSQYSYQGVHAEAVNAVRKMSRMNVHVFALVDSAKDSFIAIVMEDCGIDLEQQVYKDNSFTERLYRASQIINECLFLQKEGIIYRDLKPANLCYKESSDARGTIKSIDFAQAIFENQTAINISGTPNYAAPEVYLLGKSSYQSDMYALAGILGKILGKDKQYISRKESAYKNNMERGAFECINTSYVFNQLFSNEHPKNIDPFLLAELRDLLTLSGDSSPARRPSIDVVSKFFARIPARLAAYQLFQEQWGLMITGLRSLDNYHKKINSQTRDSAFFNINSIKNAAQEKANELYCEFLRLRMVRRDSHYSMVLESLHKNELLEANPYPDLRPIIKIINEQNQQGSRFLPDFEPDPHTQGLRYTNIIKILSSEEPAIIQLKYLVEVIFPRNLDSLIRDNERTYDMRRV